MCDKIKDMTDINDLADKILQLWCPDLTDEEAYEYGTEFTKLFYKHQDSVYDAIQTVLCDYTLVYDYRNHM
jgi:hypothetical protein